MEYSKSTLKCHKRLSRLVTAELAKTMNLRDKGLAVTCLRNFQTLYRPPTKNKNDTDELSEIVDPQINTEVYDILQTQIQHTYCKCILNSLHIPPAHDNFTLKINISYKCKQ